MDKVPEATASIVAENVAKLLKLFPECAGERGEVDFEKLKQTLADHAVEGDVERYQFTWPGKRSAMAEANVPTTKTLAPCEEESVDFANTQNLYVEGDNLEVLKILRASYLGQVKMIYIDPPYNTGKDFVYHDRFSITQTEADQRGGNVDDLGRRFTENSESNPRYHSDWCSMMYPRLKLARDLMRKDGVIYISIDDNEVKNVRELCDQIFGADNFIAQIVVDATPKNDPYVVSTAHEYCLVYCRDVQEIKAANYGVKNPRYADILKIFDDGNGDFPAIEQRLREYYKANGLTQDNIANYKYADHRGVYRTGPLDDPQGSGPKDERINPNTGKPCAIPSRGWGCSTATWAQWVANGEVLFPDDNDLLPSRKVYITADRLDVMRGYFKMQTRRDTDALKNLFGLDTTPFSNPKPVELLRTFIENCNDKQMLILDFFSGSATTFHAMMVQNALDGDDGRRKAILVQIPEPIEVHSGQSNKERKITRAAIKFLTEHGLPTNVCEIGKERIRRAGKKIKDENAMTAPNLDIGFRVLKVADSPMMDASKPAGETTQQELSFSSVKEGVKDDALLFHTMLRLGIAPTDTIEYMTVEGNKVACVGGVQLVAALDAQTQMTNAFIEAIMKMNPGVAVFRDDTFRNNNALRISLEQTKKQLSPETKIEVI